MLALPSDAAREAYLLRQFCITFLARGRQKIADRFLQPPAKHMEVSLSVTVGTYLCLAFLPLWFSMQLFYIFLKGVQFGPGATQTWLIACITAFIHQLIFLQPLKIWLKWLVLSRACRDDILHMQRSLTEQSKLIMIRTAGALKEANSRIQHLNPACRAARAFPSLGVSRLLMSCNDHDFENTVNKRNNSLEEGAEIVVLLVFFVLAFFPDIAQDIILEAFSTSGMNVVSLGLIMLGQASSLVVPIVLVVVIVGSVVALEKYRAAAKQEAAPGGSRDGG